MQNDRYSNRAREQCVFCSKKCEIEARFWLLDVLKQVGKPRGEEDDRGSRPQP
jgi:hypothetical protein